MGSLPSTCWDYRSERNEISSPKEHTPHRAKSDGQRVPAWPLVFSKAYLETRGWLSPDILNWKITESYRRTKQLASHLQSHSGEPSKNGPARDMHTEKRPLGDTGKCYSQVGILKDMDSSDGGGSGRGDVLSEGSSWSLGGFFHFLAPVLLL